MLKINDLTVSHRPVESALQDATKAINELRRTEFFRKGGALREILKGKWWMLFT